MKRPCFILIVFTLLLSACGSPDSEESAPATKTPVTAPTPQPAATLPTEAINLPTAQTTRSATPTPAPGWQTYTNNYLGYSFHYPPQATIDEEGWISMDTQEEVPPGFTFDSYFSYVETILPDNLCLWVSVPNAGFAIAPPGELIGRFVNPCPGMGIGADYRFEDVQATFVIDGQEYVVDGNRLYLQDTFDSEFFIITLDNGFRITYIGGPSEGMSYDRYLTQRGIAFDILASLHWPITPDLTKPGTTCAGNATWLVPGVEAVVLDANVTTRARTSPDTSSEVLAELPPDTVVMVRQGPVCSGDGIFWRVESDIIPGGTGWVRETDRRQYFLDPAGQPALIPTPYVNCAEGWTQLEIGDYAVVAEGDPNRVRSGPSRNDEVIAQIYPETIVHIVEGPICADGLVFWKVENNSIPGGAGWTAEGDLNNYWLEPYQP